MYSRIDGDQFPNPLLSESVDDGQQIAQIIRHFNVAGLNLSHYLITKIPTINHLGQSEGLPTL